MITISIANVPGALRSCIAGWRDIFQLANRERQTGGLPALFRTNLKPGAESDAILFPVVFGDAQLSENAKFWRERIITWHRHGKLVASACAGAFYPASAGILDGKLATTHWSLAPRFRQLFPAVPLDTARMVIRHQAGPGTPGTLVIGGGVTAWIDVGICLVGYYGGAALAERCGRILIWDPVRRQNHHADPRPMVPIHDNEAILRAEAWVEAQLQCNVRLEDWAQAAGLGLRSFERQFKHIHGTSPGAWLQSRRLDQARLLLATTSQNWKEISAACGYQDAGAFSRLFASRFDRGQQEYRRQYQRIE